MPRRGYMSPIQRCTESSKNVPFRVHKRNPLRNSCISGTYAEGFLITGCSFPYSFPNNISGMLRFEHNWRRSSPADGKFLNSHIPPAALTDYMRLARRCTAGRDSKQVLEVFKHTIADAIGEPYCSSSSAEWAETDLLKLMEEASTKPPVFIEAIWDALAHLREVHVDLGSSPLPDEEDLNLIAENHQIGYWIDPPRLLLREEKHEVVPVAPPPESLAEQARRRYQESTRRSEDLLRERRGREAVQEALWLLESVSTAYRGLEAPEGAIAGKYFVTIVKDLRRVFRGTTLERVLDWIIGLHGYLSSPTGGGVRHGADLSGTADLNINEARLFCNLIRSYISYLVEEHGRLVQADRSQ